MLSRRAHLPATPNPLTRMLAERRRAGRPVLDLTASNPTTVGLSWPADHLARAFAAPANTQYAPAPFGLPAAREAVARHLGVDAARVVLTASTSEAYAFLFKALCDPGDAVLAVTPSYPLFEHLATFEGVELHTVPLAYDGAWHLDQDAVRRALTPRTRAILLVNPNNPTGHYLRPAELEALADLGLPVLVDEVFAPYPHAGPAYRALHRPDLPLVVLDGLSKRVGLPQAKVGFTIVQGPPHFTEPLLTALEGIADTYLSLSTAAQHALPTLLADAPGIGARIHQRTQQHLAHLQHTTRHTPVEVLRVEGGWYAVLALPHTRDDEAWALELLAEGVLVQPGYFYDFSDPARVVVSLITPPDVFTAGVARLVEYVQVAAGE